MYREWDKRRQQPSALDKRMATYAKDFLKGMIQSAPIADRTAVDEKVWAAKAVDFAEALIAELKKRGHGNVS